MSHNNLPTGKAYARLSDFALDPSNVYDSYAQALDYALSSPIAYTSQVLGVREGETCHVYVIEPDRTLKRVDGVMENKDVASVLGFQSFEIGKVVWQAVEQEIPDGWLASGVIFSALEYPALFALLEESMTPFYPEIDGKIPIILGRYVDSIDVPEDRFLSISGLNREKEENLAAAVNTIIAQMEYEDRERKKIAAVIGYPALPSDDWPTLLARLRRNLDVFSEKLSVKGIFEPSDSPLRTLINRLDEIETNSTSLQIAELTTQEPIRYEKYANAVLSQLSLSWRYNDDALLKYQTLSGPGTAAVTQGIRSVTLSPNVKDNVFDFVLTGYDFEDHGIKKTLSIEYLLPVYSGVTQTFAIQSDEIVLGTKTLMPEGNCPIVYRDVAGYMYFAVPQEWTPFQKALDPHGFDYLVDSFRILTREIHTPDGTIVPYRVYISRLYNTLIEYRFHFMQ